MQPAIHVSEPARRYLLQLLDSRGIEGMSARLLVTEAGTPEAEPCLSYCNPDHENLTDTRIDMGALTLFVEAQSLPFLHDTEIDLQESNRRPGLTIKAPNATRPQAIPDGMRLLRDCPATRVPWGDTLVIPANALVHITQALGGSYTLLYQDNLVRVDPGNADALGLTTTEIKFEAPTDGRIDQDQIEAVLSTVYDPEIPVDIVNLGLVYKLEIDQNERRVNIEMTLTAPGCGMGEVLVKDVRTRVLMVPHVAGCEVNLVFDPPWTRDRMSEAAQLETGLFY